MRNFARVMRYTGYTTEDIMPAAYAHFSFGREVLKALPAPLQTIVKEHFDAFALGVHGPDLLFYYRPLFANKTSAVGYRLHFEQAAPFFARAKTVFTARGCRPEDAAYLFGYLCHFALDSTAHPLVSEKLERSPEVTHTETESSFDRLLLEREGKDPLSADLTAHIRPSSQLADIAAAYYGLPERKLRKALSSILFYNRLLRAPRPAKRRLVCAVLRLTGNYREMHGMMIPYRKDERCEDSDKALCSAFEEAVPKACELIASYETYLRGEGGLSPLLDRNYE